MESKINPYASPAVVDNSDPTEGLGSSPPLPVVFRTSILTIALMMPIGIMMAMITVSTALSAIMLARSDVHAVALLPLLTGFLTGITALGCFVPVRCKIVLTETSIEKTEFFRQVINYSEIESWHHHPVTGTVNIQRRGFPGYLAVSNWAMSREKSKILGEVLQNKVGPAHG